MVLGDPFIYFFVVVAILPLLWVAWWAVDSVFSSSRAPKAVVPAATSAKSPSYEYPRPVDLTLPRRRGAVAIYSLKERAEIDCCRGADVAGKCPRATADGTVACAGSLLSLPVPIRGSAEWQIPVGYKVCPVASYDVYRQAGSPRLRSAT